MNPSDVRGLSAEKRALLEQRLRGRGADSPLTSRALARRTSSGPAPLSVLQEPLWYFSRLAPESPVYNEAITIRKDGPFELRPFRSAFNEVVRRHEIWRSTFTVVDGEPAQVVHAASTIELPVVDLSGAPAAERETEAARIAAEEAMRPYDLATGPLLRPQLIRFAEDHHRLYLALHHLLFDGVSLYRIVLPELIALYDAFREGGVASLPEPPIQYADYAAHEKATRADDTGRIAYWRRHLDGAPTLALPLDHPRPLRQRFQGATEPVHITKELADSLRSLGRTSGATLFQVVCAAFAALLHRYTGQDDIVFGTLNDMRARRELEQMVGYCLTPLVLRVDVHDDPSFIELLSRIRADVVDGVSRQVPFEWLVRELNPRRDARNPIFQAIIVMEPAMVPVDPAWSLHQMEVEVGNAIGATKFDLHLELDERPEGHVDGRLIYNTDLFEPETATRVAGHWTVLLQAIAQSAAAPISQLPLLSQEERHRQLVQWNATSADYPRHACLHDLVTAQVQRTPGAIAAVFGDEQLSYQELDRRAARVAQRLRQANPGAGLVAIYAERSLDMLVAMLGILKSGAAYLPLDLGTPAERLEFMLEDSAAAIVLTQRHLLPTLPDHRPAVVSLDGEAWADLPDGAPATAVTAEGLAYVLYTSGSTGRPKGVCIQHRAVVNLLTSFARQPGMGPADRVLAVTTYAFDIAAIELWLPLITGARTVIVPRDVASDGRLLARLLEESDITIMQATPATWQMLIDAGWRGQAGLVALCGGEALTPQLADSLLHRGASVWNVYGPTETTVWSTAGAVQPDSPVTIGRPIANTRVYILGRGRQPVPVGVPGELVIGGDGVALGYLNRPDLTAERFVADPFVAGARVYLTGDLARYRSDGRIEHLGRLDHQIKIRGFRVEPGEIEAALTGHPAVTSALVVSREHAPGDTRLVAYVVPQRQGAAPTASELRRRLRATLPEYMVPSTFVTLDALPLSVNGKIDRTALPAPGPSVSDEPTRSATQGSVLEKRMAAIWARILGVERVGLDDDFFELGGHSLLALRLLLEVERELGVEVPLAAFFESAGTTVAGLTANIAPAQKGQAGGLGVPIAQEAFPILFFVHPHESSLLTLRHFQRPLGSDHRLVGLVPERMGGRFDRTQSIESLARPILDTVRRAQPHGPYYLAGYSLGGLLAYEIAGRLRAAGEPVAWLGILDAATPAAEARWLRRELSLRQRAVRQWKRGPRGALVKTDEVLRREVRSQLVSLRLRQAQITDDFDGLGAARLAVRYACPGHDAALDLFATEPQIAAVNSDSLGWEGVHRGVLRVHRVGGDHVAMVTDGHVDALAEMVSAGLKEARRVWESG